MYQLHNTGWCLVSLVVYSAILAGVWLVLRQRQVKPPPWLVLVLALGGVAQILFPGLLRVYDETQMRNELRSMVREQVSQVLLTQGGRSKPVTDPQLRAQLLLLVQSLRNIAAHHSSATDIVGLSLTYQGQTYEYAIGRDSAIPTEFWILATKRSMESPGREIGRVQSSQLGQLLSDLLQDKR